MNPSIKHNLRWIAVLPVAIAAYFALAFLTAILQELTIWRLKYIWELTSAIFAPFAFVYLGAKTAPNNHLITAISLALLHAVCLALIFGFIGYALIMQNHQFKDPVWWDAIKAVIGVIMTIWACANISKKV